MSTAVVADLDTDPQACRSRPAGRATVVLRRFVANRGALVGARRAGAAVPAGLRRAAADALVLHRHRLHRAAPGALRPTTGGAPTASARTSSRRPCTGSRSHCSSACWSASSPPRWPPWSARAPGYFGGWTDRVLMFAGRPAAGLPQLPGHRDRLAPAARRRLVRLRRPARRVRLDDHRAGRAVHDAVAAGAGVRAGRAVHGRRPVPRSSAAHPAQRRLVPDHRRHHRGRRRRHERDRAVVLRLRHPAARRLPRHPHRRRHHVGGHLPVDVLLRGRAARGLRARGQPRRRRPARRHRPHRPRRTPRSRSDRRRARKAPDDHRAPDAATAPATAPRTPCSTCATCTSPSTASRPSGASTSPLRRGEVLGLVGESGSGKSSVALAVLGLLPASARVCGTACSARARRGTGRARRRGRRRAVQGARQPHRHGLPGPAVGLHARLPDR